MIPLIEGKMPNCVKCDEMVSGGATLISGKWICGQCFADYMNKLQKDKLKAVLEG